MEKVTLDLYAASAAKVFEQLNAGNAVELDGYCLTPDDDGIVWIDKPNGSDGGSFALERTTCERYLARLQASGRSATYSPPARPEAPLVDLDDEPFDDDLGTEPPQDEDSAGAFASLR
jgi:hypothetical protein